MLYFFTVLSVALGNIVSATPIVTPKAAVVTTIAASFPISELGELAVHSNTTLAGRTRLHGLAARQEFPADLLLCPTSDCANCVVTTIEAELQNICQGSSFPILSAAISQLSNEGLPFGVFVGTTGCASSTQIPAVNECFNVNGLGGTPFDTFIVLA